MFATSLTRTKDFTSLPYLLLHVNNSFCRILPDTVASRQFHQEKYLSPSTPHDAEVSLKFFNNYFPVTSEEVCYSIPILPSHIENIFFIR